MKSFKSFVTEYAMGLQVPATSYMKPMGNLISGKPLRKKEDNERRLTSGKPLRKKESVKPKKEKKDSEMGQ